MCIIVQLSCTWLIHINSLPYEHSPLPHSHKDATQKEKESTKFINLNPQDTVIEDTPQQTPVESGGWFGAWHFLIIFLLIAALVGIVYFCSHNRKKVCSVLYCAWHLVVEPIIIMMYGLLGPLHIIAFTCIDWVGSLVIKCPNFKRCLIEYTCT